MRNCLLVTGLLAVSLPAQHDSGPAINTSLEQMRIQPEAFRGVKASFVVQFSSLGRISNPFFTQFTPAEYANFYGWGEDQPIWRKESYENMFGFFFLAKTHPKLNELYALRTYQRLKLTGVVRNTFQDQPWIEILDFEPVEGHVDLAVLTHLYRGEQYMQQRRWQRAIAELSLAPGDGVPGPALLAIHKNMGICHLRIGEASKALTHLQEASKLGTEPDIEVERYLATASTEPSLELDRAISQTVLRDHERPMWEAFDNGEQKR